MSQWKMTSTPKPFFTGLIVQCFERNDFQIPVGIHESLETLMSFPLAQVKTGTANPTDSSEHPLGFCIFGIWIILPPGPTARCKCCRYPLNPCPLFQSPSNCIWSLSERIKHCWVLHAMLGTQSLLGQSDTSQTNENLKKIKCKLKLNPWACPQWARTKQCTATKGNKRGVGFLHAVCLNKPLLQRYCGVVLSFQKAFVREPKTWYRGF